MGDCEIESFIKKYVDELRDENAAFFAGAGFSLESGFVDWKTLMKNLAESVGLDSAKESDFVAVAQYNCNKYKNRSNINDTIFKEFSRNLTPTENHKILARLPIRTIWTTNYDHLIEEAMNENYRIADVKSCNEHLSLTKPNRDCVIYKMHGDRDNPAEAVLIKDDYERYYRQHKQFLSALAGDLISKTFLFVGFSFTDPNIDYILSRVRIEYEKNDRQHYAIMRELKRKGYRKAEFEYAKRKNELFLDDLKRYKITPLIVKEYSCITDILSKIERRLNSRNVFISGSAIDYGDFSRDEAEKFISELSSQLIREGYNIISGFGLGVGSYVINGALEETCKIGGRIRDERLLLRPFPQGDRGQKYWKKYREDMISRAGISIFIFGNKKVNDSIFLANGMREEFEIARSKGNLIVPVGCTGYVAKEIWEMVDKKMEDYYPGCTDEIKTVFLKLFEKNDIESMIKNIIYLLDLLRKE